MCGDGPRPEKFGVRMLPRFSPSPRLAVPPLSLAGESCGEAGAIRLARAPSSAFGTFSRSAGEGRRALLRLVQIYETRLIKAVIRRLHPERRIRLLRPGVFLLDVKPEPD